MYKVILRLEAETFVWMKRTALLCNSCKFVTRSVAWNKMKRSEHIIYSLICYFFSFLFFFFFSFSLYRSCILWKMACGFYLLPYLFLNCIDCSFYPVKSFGEVRFKLPCVPLSLKAQHLPA